MERQFTATVYIVHEDKVLLHRHAKLGKWLPPGGHVEANETPPEAARREAKEETNLDIAFIEQENLKIDAENATSFERPFLCLLEHIPPFKDQPAHQHMDMIYVARPILPLPQDLGGFRWLSQQEILEIESELFPDVKAMIELLLEKERVVP
jgi:8-oxo-dGTP pyrophosphatase MutT (NUDIX family)